VKESVRESVSECVSERERECVCVCVFDFTKCLLVCHLKRPLHASQRHVVLLGVEAREAQVVVQFHVEQAHLKFEDNLIILVYLLRGSSFTQIYISLTLYLQTCRSRR